MYKISEIQDKTSYPYYYCHLIDGIPVEADFTSPLVQAAIKMKSDLTYFILSKIKNTLDTEDIYQETLVMLAKKRVLPMDELILRKYILGCANITIKRYFSKKAADQKMCLLVEDEKLNIVDPTSDNLLYDFGEKETEEGLVRALKRIEGKRYRYGCDIFLLLFVRLLNPTLTTKDYVHIISLITSEDKKQLTLAYRGVMQDESIIEILGMLLNLDNAINILAQYVYCSDDIQVLVCN